MWHINLPLKLWPIYPHMNTYELESSIIQLSTDLPLFDKYIFLPWKKHEELCIEICWPLRRKECDQIEKCVVEFSKYGRSQWPNNLQFIFIFLEQWNSQILSIECFEGVSIYKFQFLNMNRPYAHCSSLNQISKADILPNLLSHVKRISHSSILISLSFVVNRANFLSSVRCINELREPDSCTFFWQIISNVIFNWLPHFQIQALKLMIALVDRWYVCICFRCNEIFNHMHTVLLIEISSHWCTIEWRRRRGHIPVILCEWVNE